MGKQRPSTADLEKLARALTRPEDAAALQLAASARASAHVGLAARGFAELIRSGLATFSTAAAAGFGKLARSLSWFVARADQFAHSSELAGSLSRIGVATAAGWDSCQDPWRMLLTLQDTPKRDRLRRLAEAFGATALPEDFGVIEVAAAVIPDDGPAPDTARMAAVLRDLFGNPFVTIEVDPAWLAWSGGTVPRLARMIDEEGDYGCLPVLADALEESGCTDERLLGHLRGLGEHWPGCWAVALLGMMPDR
jgi:hypothetical protein